MRRNNGALILIIFIVFALLLSGFGIYASEKNVESVSARAAALYDPNGDRFLYSKCMNEHLYMASTTKIMTALVVAENLPLDKVVSFPACAVGTEGSSAYFEEGEHVTVEGLLFALLLRSANDAAVALATEVSGNIEGFALLMNDRADALGLTDTNFKNPHGLHDDEHYTTAHDLALIAAEAMKNDTVARIMSQRKHTVTTDLSTHVFYNHNKLLNRYDGACGVKTGFTKDAGRCLVGAAMRDGITLISVTLDAPDDWNDHERMLDFGFSVLENRNIARRGDFNRSLPVLGSDKDKIEVAIANDVNCILMKNEQLPKSEVRLSRYTTAPIEVGDTVGEVVFTRDGKEIARAPLVAKESAAVQKKKNLFDKIKSFFKRTD